MIGRNDPCWCGSQKKWKKCHFPQHNPQVSFKTLSKEYLKKYQILLKTPEQIAGIRKACKFTREVLEKVCAKAKAGVTPLELNDYAQQLMDEAGAISAALHYGDPPFPKSICISLNEVVCHGIPDSEPFIEGDIANIDISCIVDGYYGDCSNMVVIGKTTPERQLVVDVAKEALMRAISILKPGVMISKIGETISDYTESQGCSVVYQFVAHGVGNKFHEPPQILHSRNKHNIPLAPHMTFTIEPMINAGAPDAIIDPSDRWTARTIDGRASAQWEHTILITETGYEILT